MKFRADDFKKILSFKPAKKVCAFHRNSSLLGKYELAQTLTRLCLFGLSCRGSHNQLFQLSNAMPKFKYAAKITQIMYGIIRYAAGFETL